MPRWSRKAQEAEASAPDADATLHVAENATEEQRENLRQSWEDLDVGKRHEPKVLEPGIEFKPASAIKTRTYLVDKQNVTASAASEAEMIDALRVVCVARFGECKPGSGRLVHEGDHRYSWRR